MKWPAQAERRVRVCDFLAPDNSASHVHRLVLEFCVLVSSASLALFGKGSSSAGLLEFRDSPIAVTSSERTRLGLQLTNWQGYAYYVSYYIRILRTRSVLL